MKTSISEEDAKDDLQQASHGLLLLKEKDE